MATKEEIETIAAMRMDGCAREMMAEGVCLDWAQVDALGEDCIDWLRTRLGLALQTTEDGIEASPAR